ncbi:deleted in azoospermia-like [Clytia hemisphaerica]|uniref:Boule-like 3 n=1 Tax=Clytia hemisphaerica TaxID=252671 RepID=A0A0N7I759_9CNID|nr:boule-like 3 [Clytia hemisphaerica]|eukprot:TCONS_00005021-protein
MADVVKYGIQIPNRVFVGGVAFDTKEDELKGFFQQYGKIKECKIIKDNQSISRGFAFVTFESKHDAIQAQQKGTVFFNQKKLNLGPAIRQKGVVFNGTKEAGNDPVLSTGVYIHPSGYSYTVAPNGVWYFHKPDGSPPSTAPGAPPMAYTPTTMQKIASQSSPTSTKASSSEKMQESGVDENRANTTVTHSNMPIYQNPGVIQEPVQIPQTTIQPDIHYQPTSYVQHTHSTFGGSNIHVAFQNMSITTHPQTTPIPVGPAAQMTVPLTIPPSSEHIPADMNGGHNPGFNYVNESCMPYYPNGKYCSQGSQTGAIPADPSRPVPYPMIPRTDYIPVVNSSMYTIYGDAFSQQQQPAYFLPNSYVDQPYCSSQVPMVNCSKRGYYPPQIPNGKPPVKKETSNVMKNNYNQMHLQSQVV